MSFGLLTGGSGRPRKSTSDVDAGTALLVGVFAVFAIWLLVKWIGTGSQTPSATPSPVVAPAKLTPSPLSPKAPANLATAEAALATASTACLKRLHETSQAYRVQKITRDTLRERGEATLYARACREIDKMEAAAMLADSDVQAALAAVKAESGK